MSTAKPATAMGCYANNPNLYRLLRACGYDADLCGAEMSAPDVHIVVVVRLGGRELLADVGYAAPFFEPMPRDLDCDHSVEWGWDRFVLRPQDDLRRSVVDQYRDGERVHGYVANPTPRTLDHFADVIAGSYSDEASFIQSVVVVRFWPGRMVRLHNQTVVEAGEHGVEIRRLDDRAEIPETVERLFGISARLTARAIEGIGDFADIYS